jgi:hypothetical protein
VLSEEEGPSKSEFQGQRNDGLRARPSLSEAEALDGKPDRSRSKIGIARTINQTVRPKALQRSGDTKPARSDCCAAGPDSGRKNRT